MLEGRCTRGGFLFFDSRVHGQPSNYSSSDTLLHVSTPGSLRSSRASFFLFFKEVSDREAAWNRELVFTFIRFSTTDRPEGVTRLLLENLKGEDKFILSTPLWNLLGPQGRVKRRRFHGRKR